MTSYIVSRRNIRRASKSLVRNLSILLATSIIETCHAFMLSELDSLREESGSVSYRVGFLGEFEVAKRALKMAYTISDCSATTLLEFSAT